MHNEAEKIFTTDSTTSYDKKESLSKKLSKSKVAVACSMWLVEIFSNHEFDFFFLVKLHTRAKKLLKKVSSTSVLGIRLPCFWVVHRCISDKQNFQHSWRNHTFPKFNPNTLDLKPKICVYICNNVWMWFRVDKFFLFKKLNDKKKGPMWNNETYEGHAQSPVIILGRCSRQRKHFVLLAKFINRHLKKYIPKL